MHRINKSNLLLPKASESFAFASDVAKFEPFTIKALRQQPSHQCHGTQDDGLVMYLVTKSHLLQHYHLSIT